MGVSQEPFEPRLVQKLEALRSVPPMLPETAQRCRTSFLEQVDRLSEAEFAAQAVSGEAIRRHIGWKSLFTTLFHRKERSPMFTSLALVVVTVSLLFGGAGASVYAAQDSLPGEILYPLKSFTEQTRLEFTPQAEGRLTLHMQYIERRVHEISRMAQAGEVPPEPWHNQLIYHLEQSLQLAAGMEDAQAIHALVRLREMLMNQDRILAAIHAPGDAPVQGEMLQVRQQIQERLRLVEDGLRDPNMLRERLRLRFSTPGQGTGTPAAQPSHTPDPMETQAPGVAPGYGPGPHASGTPGSGSCPEGTCTPNEYEHDYEEPRPHGNATEVPGGNSNGPGPAATQAPGGCTDCGQGEPSKTEEGHDQPSHPDNGGGGQNSGGDPGGNHDGDPGGGDQHPSDPGHGGGGNH